MTIYPEMISCSCFNEKFKNNLRDFFVYQFKEFAVDGESDYKRNDSNENKALSTFRDEKKRLHNLLNQETGIFFTQYSKTMSCCTGDLRSLKCNPFYVLYQYCLDGTNDAEWYYNVIFALSNKVKSKLLASVHDDNIPTPLLIIAEKMLPFKRNRNELTSEDKLAYSKEYYEQLSEQQKLDLARTKKKEEIIRLAKCDNDKIISMTIQQLQLYCSLHGCNEISTRQFLTRMRKLEALGIVVGRHDEKNNKTIFWTLTNCFIGDLINTDTDTDLKQRFKEMVCFFSEAGDLGAIGSFITRRFGDQDSCFCYKYYYITQALCEYNLIDILYAIENEKWLKIKYRNAVDLKYQVLICWPLQVRKSLQTGRTYLLYYHSQFRSVSSLRLEFIDEIIIGNITAANNEIPTAQIQSDLLQARQALSKMWGVSITGFAEGNVQTTPPNYQVKMTVDYDPLYENYILKRIRCERRHGIYSAAALSVTYSVTVTDYYELLPWVRSFNGRIKSFDVNGQSRHELLLPTTIIGTANNTVTEKHPSSISKIWFNDEQQFPFSFIIDKNVAPHSLLFNKIFSHNYELLGRVLLTMLNEPEKDYSSYQIDDLCCQFSAKLNADQQIREKKYIKNKFAKLYQNKTSLFSSKYKTDQERIDSHFDLLPLTKIEIQWLQGILESSRARLFLDKEEILVIQQFLAVYMQQCSPQKPNCTEQKLFDMRKIFYYDHYIGGKEYFSEQQYINAFRTVLTALKQHYWLDLNYTTHKKSLISGRFAPACLEYSKKENIFRLYAVSEKGTVRIFNLERIETVSLTSDSYIHKNVASALADYRANNKQQITISFYNRNGITDKILNEFSYCKKNCTYNKRSGKFSLTVEYDDSDYKDIIIRLLGYGPDIEIIDNGSVISQDYRARIARQLDLFKMTGCEQLK